MIDYATFEAEARRIYFRYAVEVVEAFTFCPWAKAAREAGRVRCAIVFGAEPALDALLGALRAADEDAGADVTLLVMPECRLDRVELRHLTATLHARYAAAAGPGRALHALADFHPSAPLDAGSPDRLVPFIRKSPDPTLQLIRHAALDAAQRGAHEGTRAATLEMMLKGALQPHEPAHARVAAANHRTVQRAGSAVILERLAAIASDRAASYARLGVTPVAWDL